MGQPNSSFKNKSHLHGLAIYVKEGPCFARDLNNSYLRYQFSSFLSVSYVFFFNGSSISIFFVQFFYVVSSNIEKVFSTNPFLTYSSLETWEVLQRGGQPIIAELIHLVNFTIFLSSAALLKLLTIPLASLTVKLIALLFRISLQLLT